MSENKIKIEVRINYLSDTYTENICIYKQILGYQKYINIDFNLFEKLSFLS